MSRAIEAYKAEKSESDLSTKWAARLTGGELRVFSVASGENSPTIYKVDRATSTLYHKMPDSLRPHLEAAIRARFSELVNDALARQAAILQGYASQAVSEYTALLAEAGIPTGR